jgi:hypothetical protein
VLHHRLRQSLQASVICHEQPISSDMMHGSHKQKDSCVVVASVDAARDLHHRFVQSISAEVTGALQLRGAWM